MPRTCEIWGVEVNDEVEILAYPNGIQDMHKQFTADVGLESGCPDECLMVKLFVRAMANCPFCFFHPFAIISISWTYFHHIPETSLVKITSDFHISKLITFYLCQNTLSLISTVQSKHFSYLTDHPFLNSVGSFSSLSFKLLFLPKST